VLTPFASAQFPAPVPIETTIRQLGSLEQKEITESSGIALSTRNQNVLWTHNDSGDTARIFAFDLTGKHLGEFLIKDTSFVDAEDIVAYEHEGKHRLLIGDFGDNRSKRKSARLYVVKEPKLDDVDPGTPETLKVIRNIKYRYENGPQNCESIGIDASTRTLYFVEKNQLIFNDHVASFYKMDWPKKDKADIPIAKAIGTMSYPSGVAGNPGGVPFMTTAADMSRDGKRFVVSTYSVAYEYVRSEGQSWEEAFKQAPRRMNMPLRRQGESICYSADGTSFYLTSEHQPSPLWEVEPKD